MKDYTQCLDNPFGYINTTTSWNRYTPFEMRVYPQGNLHTSQTTWGWIPYHKNYCALWAAQKWGTHYASDYYHYNNLTIYRFILDNKTGKIAWRNYDERSGELLLRA